jgi:hypothetical protein
VLFLGSILPTTTITVSIPQSTLPPLLNYFYIYKKNGIKKPATHAHNQKKKRHVNKIEFRAQKKVDNCIYLFLYFLLFRVITYIKRRRRAGFFLYKKNRKGTKKWVLE